MSMALKCEKPLEAAAPGHRPVCASSLRRHDPDQVRGVVRIADSQQSDFCSPRALLLVRL